MTDLNDAVNLAAELGPLPTPRECGAYGYQLEVWINEIRRGRAFKNFSQEAQEGMRNGYPRWIMDATRLRMEKHGGFGAYQRKFHHKPWMAADVQEHIGWWMVEVDR